MSSFSVSIALLGSFLLCGISILLANSRFRIGVDASRGPQKFHHGQIARTGGVGIFISLIVLHALSPDSIPKTFDSSLFIILAGIPAFVAGLIEDVTSRVGVAVRLSATMLSSAIAMFLFGGVLERVDLPGIDHLLTIAPLAIAFTIFSVGGIANALNIVDGYNGLAGVLGAVILLSLGLVAYNVGDGLIAFTSISSAAATLGFVVWNYPKGRIFLGDGGAYFVGYLIGQLSVLLVSRNPGVSPWFPLMLVAYPVWETFFSIYRKRFVRRMSPGQPDGLHLHMLVYKRLVRYKPFSPKADDRILRNSLTSPYLWGLASIGIIPALIWWQNSMALIASAAVFACVYGWLYQSIVSFKVPRWVPRITTRTQHLTDVSVETRAAERE